MVAKINLNSFLNTFIQSQGEKGSIVKASLYME